MHRLLLDLRHYGFERALNRRESRLYLPAVKVRAVVGQRHADAAHYVGRDPGFTTGTPCAHSGHAAGSHASTCIVASAARGTPTSARPPLRSIIDPAASTCAP